MYFTKWGVRFSSSFLYRNLFLDYRFNHHHLYNINLRLTTNWSDLEGTHHSNLFSTTIPTTIQCKEQHKISRQPTIVQISIFYYFIQQSNINSLLFIGYNSKAMFFVVVVFMQIIYSSKVLLLHHTRRGEEEGRRRNEGIETWITHKLSMNKQKICYLINCQLIIVLCLSMRLFSCKFTCIHKATI